MIEKVREVWYDAKDLVFQEGNARCCWHFRRVTCACKTFLPQNATNITERETNRQREQANQRWLRPMLFSYQKVCLIQYFYLLWSQNLSIKNKTLCPDCEWKYFWNEVLCNLSIFACHDLALLDQLTIKLAFSDFTNKSIWVVQNI